MSISRRDLLKLFGLYTTSYTLLNPEMEFKNIFAQGLIEKAKAAELGIPARNYIFIHNVGAPSRWTFDLFLNRQSNEKLFVENKGVVNAFKVGESSIHPEYREIIIEDAFGKKVGIPHLWGTSVPVPSKGMTPLKDLLQSAISIRGIDMIAPAHNTASIFLQTPDPNKPSLAALAADGRKSKIPAVATGRVGVQKLFPFVSKEGKNAVFASSDPNKIVNEVMGAFDRNSNTSLKSLIESTGDSINNVIDSLSRSTASINMAGEQKAAKKLMDSEFEKFQIQWPSLLSKYQGIIDEVISSDFVIEGVNDKPLEGLSGGADSQLSGTVAENKDLRTIIGKKTNIPNLASQFAMAEYMICNNISSVIRIDAVHMTGVNLQEKIEKIDSETEEKKVTFKNRFKNYISDEHSTARYISTIANSHYYAALGACILELTEMLKASKTEAGHNLFDETLIHLSGEFNRAPKKNGTGSDHGYSGSSTLLMSGSIKGFHLLGNIYNEPPGKGTRGRYPGTWGYAAPMEFLFGETITYGNVLSSVAEILRVSSPSPFRLSLVKDVGGRISLSDESLKTAAIKKAG